MLPHRHGIGLGRREVLQAGFSGLMGLGLPSVLGRRVSAAPEAATAGRSPKSLVIVFLTGACSHHDTFDMKLEAPAEIRGEFQPIATSIPSYSICEHLPQLAALLGGRQARKSVAAHVVQGHPLGNCLFQSHAITAGRHAQPASAQVLLDVVGREQAIAVHK